MILLDVIVIIGILTFLGFLVSKAYRLIIRRMEQRDQMIKLLQQALASHDPKRVKDVQLLLDARSAEDLQERLDEHHNDLVIDEHSRRR